MRKEIVLADEHLILLPEKAIYWPARKILLISDLHLGKINHFRSAGIGVPFAATQDNYLKLKDLFFEIDPERVIFLGDLFHSILNNEWALFCDFIKGFSAIKFELVLGNHDILEVASYDESNMEVYQTSLNMGPFHLTHHPSEKCGFFNVCGHLHPGIRLRGKSRQSVRLACYFVQKNRIILPAFGTFTGMHLVTPQKGERVYAVVNEEIVKIEQ